MGGKDGGAPILFLGLCCHPVVISLYWPLPAASSQYWTTWIREGPFPSCMPSSLSPQQQEGPAHSASLRICVRGAALKSPTTVLKAQATRPQHHASIRRGSPICPQQHSWRQHAVTVPAVQLRNAALKYDWQMQCTQYRRNTGDVEGNPGAPLWKCWVRGVSCRLSRVGRGWRLIR